MAGFATDPEIAILNPQISPVSRNMASCLADHITGFWSEHFESQSTSLRNNQGLPDDLSTSIGEPVSGLPGLKPGMVQQFKCLWGAGFERQFGEHHEADEPASALDVTIQAQILDLLLELVDHHNLTMLFISHDLSVVRYLADRILVMHQGQLVEQGNTEDMWSKPQHDYAKSLLSAIPIADPHRERNRQRILTGL